MRVLIVGGTGFIGVSLANSLIEEGNQVTCVTRNKQKAIDLVPSLHNIFQMDVASKIPEKSIFSEVDAVVNLAGKRIPGIWTKHVKKMILDTRVNITHNLVTAMKGTNVEIFISGSALGIYGDREDEYLTEQSTVGSGFLASVCKQWEDAAQNFEGRLVLLRSGHVIGTGGLMKPMEIIGRLGLLGRLGSGKQWWPWIHIEDEIGIIKHSINTASVRGPINAASPNPVRQKDFAKTLAKVINRPCLLPAPKIAIQKILGEFSTEILSSRRMVPSEAISSGYKFVYEDLIDALNEVIK